jgi:hypothetical protein
MAGVCGRICRQPLSLQPQSTGLPLAAQTWCSLPSAPKIKRLAGADPVGTAAGFWLGGAGVGGVANGFQTRVPPGPQKNWQGATPLMLTKPSTLTPLIYTFFCIHGDGYCPCCGAPHTIALAAGTDSEASFGTGAAVGFGPDLVRPRPGIGTAAGPGSTAESGRVMTS